MNTRRVLLACDLDSQIYGALPLARVFAARGWRVTFSIDAESEAPAQLLARLKRDFDVIERPFAMLPVDDFAFEQDAIGIFATGSQLALFRSVMALAARVRRTDRPTLFCGFNGLVFEKFEEGVAWRLGFDIIGLNGPRDRDAFLDFVRDTPFETQPYAIVGLKRRTDGAPRSLSSPSLGEFETSGRKDALDADGATAERRDAASIRCGEPKLFVFAEQVVVPRSARERETLVALLADLAERSPGWVVMLKARVRPDEATFYGQSAHVATLVANLPSRPANFQLSYEPLEDALARADLFGTISSTALFDALDHGVPCIVASDFGLRNADGVHVFFASGLLTALADLPSLDAASRRAPSKRWLEHIGYGSDHSPHALIERLERSDFSTSPPVAFVSFATAAKSALNCDEQIHEACALYDAVEQALAVEDDHSAKRSLDRLATLFADAQAASRLSKQTRSTMWPIEALARFVGVYKRVLRAFGSQTQ